MSTIKVFDKKSLKLANNIAIKRGYNRAIVEEHINSQPEDAHWAVMFWMPHEHAAGRQVDTHIRCMLRQLFIENSPTLFVDTDASLFEMLPEIEVGIEKGNKTSQQKKANTK
jgi:hypothetical protein